jgi:hypothetical protein
MAPMALPSRTLKAAIDFFAFVVTGFWPAICVRSATSGSSSLEFCVASPRPMLITIFLSCGTAIAFSSPSSFWSACLISLWYFSFNLAAISLLSFFRLSDWAQPVYRFGRDLQFASSSSRSAFCSHG